MSDAEFAKNRPAVDVLSQTRLRVMQPYRPATELKVDRALGPEIGQEDLFGAVADVIEGVVHGRSGTILAYGQTGSGKTYMMSGPQCAEGEFAGRPVLAGEERGLIPRALESLFDHLWSQPEGWRVRVSFMEIYNEQVFDLLDTSGSLKGLDLREGRSGPVEAAGLQAVEVQDLDEALQLLDEGTENRAWADNGINATSSRSHALFQVVVENPFGGLSKLSLVDLAGSEKLQPGHGVTNAETTKINLSLTALGQCIAALLDVKRKHVPWRNSKLTRLLQEPLQDPSSATVMCVCISPSDNSISETMSALQFADRAKRVVLQRRETQFLAHQSSTASDSATLQRRVEELTAHLVGAKDEARREKMERARLEEVIVAMRSESAAPSPQSSLLAAAPQVMAAVSEQWESGSAPAGDRYTMEEGTSTLQLAFEMAKQGLEDILAVVAVLDHDDLAVSRAKQGLQEIVGAVDTLQCISMESAQGRLLKVPCETSTEANTGSLSPALCRSASSSSLFSRTSSISNCSRASSSTNTSPQSDNSYQLEDGVPSGTRRNLLMPTGHSKTKSAPVKSVRTAVSQCWNEFENELRSESDLCEQDEIMVPAVTASRSTRGTRGTVLFAEAISKRGSLS